LHPTWPPVDPISGEFVWNALAYEWDLAAGYSAPVTEYLNILMGQTDATRELRGDQTPTAIDELLIYQGLITDFSNGFGAAAPPSYISGDANKDGYVNDDDLALLLTSWKQTGQAWGNGDFNDDGLVNDDDLALLLTNWKQGVPPVASIVPEPASLSLIGLGALALIRRRRAA
jgi:hypothetical protein